MQACRERQCQCACGRGVVAGRAGVGVGVSSRSLGFQAGTVSPFGASFEPIGRSIERQFPPSSREREYSRVHRFRMESARRAGNMRPEFISQRQTDRGVTVRSVVSSEFVGRDISL